MWSLLVQWVICSSFNAVHLIRAGVAPKAEAPVADQEIQRWARIKKILSKEEIANRILTWISSRNRRSSPKRWNPKQNFNMRTIIQEEMADRNWESKSKFTDKIPQVPKHEIVNKYWWKKLLSKNFKDWSTLMSSDSREYPLVYNHLHPQSYLKTGVKQKSWSDDSKTRPIHRSGRVKIPCRKLI